MKIILKFLYPQGELLLDYYCSKQEETENFYTGLNFNQIQKYENLVYTIGYKGDLCVKYGDIIIISGKTLQPVITEVDESNGKCKFKISIMDKIIEELGIFSNETPLIFEIVERSTKSLL